MDIMSYTKDGKIYTKGGKIYTNNLFDHHGSILRKAVCRWVKQLKFESENFRENNKWGRNKAFKT